MKKLNIAAAHWKHAVSAPAQYGAMAAAATAAVLGGGTGQAGRHPTGAAQVAAHDPANAAGHVNAAVLAQAAEQAAAGCAAVPLPASSLSSTLSSVSPDGSAGSGPDRKLPSSKSAVSAPRRPSSAGTLPFRKFPLKSLRVWGGGGSDRRAYGSCSKAAAGQGAHSSCSVVALPSDAGMDPVR